MAVKQRSLCTHLTRPHRRSSKNNAVLSISPSALQSIWNRQPSEQDHGYLVNRPFGRVWPMSLLKFQQMLLTRPVLRVFSLADSIQALQTPGQESFCCVESPALRCITVFDSEQFLKYPSSIMWNLIWVLCFGRFFPSLNAMALKQREPILPLG